MTEVRPGMVLRHRPTGNVGPVKWISPHPDVTFVYVETPEVIQQGRLEDYEEVRDDRDGDH